MKHNPENERIKRRYLGWLREAKGYSVSSVDAAAKALSRFEEDTRYRDFRSFHFEQAKAFKRHLAEQIGQKSGQKLSKATLRATLIQLRQFFFWLADQPGYKSNLQHSDAEYFNLSDKDMRIATACRERPAPTLERVQRVIETMPSRTEIQRRDQALIAFALLTGARDSAIASIKLKHVDLNENCIHQDPHEVRTKFGKAIETYFFPVGDGIREIVSEWVRFLRKNRLWGNDDPLFPATRIVVGQTRKFEIAGLDQAPWSSAQPIRKVFREAFERVGLPYFNPHSLRKTLAQLGERVCETPEDFKAWSQNLGHEQVMTTFVSYGAVATDRQGAIIRALGVVRPSNQPGADDIAEAVLRKLQSAGKGVPTTT
jgi:integrase